MSDEIENIDKNPKSWAAWKREAERLQAIVDGMALAAMDSEPVAFIFKHPAGRLFWSLTDESNKGHDDVMPVYAAPQPAMVAPVCTCPSGDGSLRWPCPVHPGNSPAQSDCCPAQNCIHSAQGVDRPVAWHHTAKSKEGNHGTCCFSYASSHDFGPRYEKPQSQPHYLPEKLDYDRALHFLSTEPRKVTPETVIGGSSPVIPDGWTGNDKANAALMMLDRIETVDPVDDDRIDGIKRIVRELAAAPHDTPALNSVQSVVTVPGKWIPVSEQKRDCWCRTCRPVVLNDMRFVVCPDCGNKRCPRANDHRNACTGSNEPGQGGSAYPDTPREVKP